MTDATHHRVDAALRHLLQDADPLPLFKRLPDGLTVQAFFENYLVARGPPETSARRAVNYSAIQWSPIFENERRILQALTLTALERKKEIRALSAFRGLTDTCSAIHRETAAAREAVEFVFRSIFVFAWCEQQSKGRKQRDYSRNPLQMVQEFVRLALAWQTGGRRLDIIYAFVARDLSFERFRQAHPQLCQFDSQLALLFGEHQDEVIDDIFPLETLPEGKFSKMNWLRARARRIRDRPDFRDLVDTAATESAPHRKLDDFGRVLMLVRAFFLETFPPDQELGEDELLPAQIAFLVIANPPCLASNFVYMRNTCGPRKYDQLFTQRLVHPLSVLKLVTCKIRSREAAEIIGDIEISD